MIQLGITGGIGSGKSTVCKIFSSLGVPVNDTDALAKKIIVEDVNLKKSILNYFGEDAYFTDGNYNRAYISNIVFNDKEKLAKLNSLVHPKVIEYSKIWTDKHKHLPYVIKEAALMFESGSYKNNDFNIVVESPIALRVQRICKRDNVELEIANKKIQAQMNDEDRRTMADLIISNDDQQSLIKQVMNIHHNLLEKNDPR